MQTSDLKARDICSVLMLYAVFLAQTARIVVTLVTTFLHVAFSFISTIALYWLKSLQHNKGHLFYRFEDLNIDLFARTLNPVEKALRNGEFPKDQINEILMTGGSMHIPKVQSLLIDHFDKKPLNKSLNPQEAVVYGAAVNAAILGNEGSAAIQDLLLLDATSLSLGIETAGGLMMSLIKQNSIVPIKETQKYTTHADNQKGVKIQVFYASSASGIVFPCYTIRLKAVGKAGTTCKK